MHDRRREPVVAQKIAALRNGFSATRCGSLPDIVEDGWKPSSGSSPERAQTAIPDPLWDFRQTRLVRGDA